MGQPQTGTLLLAEPFLLDPNFKRAAIALVDHHDEGTVGFVLNATTETRVSDLLEGFPDFAGHISIGGPVQQDTLHFVHTLGNLLDDAHAVHGYLYWGGDFEQLTLFIREGIADTSNVRFFLGYSGWSPGQLAEECSEKTWVYGELTPDLVFATPPDQVWPKAMRRLGHTFEIIGEMGDVPLN